MSTTKILSAEALGRLSGASGQTPVSRMLGHGQGGGIFVKLHVSLRQRLRDLRGPSGVVFLALALRTNGNGIVWPSVETIARECGLARRTTERAVTNLIKMGLIQRHRRGRTLTNLYRVHSVSFGSAEPQMPQSDRTPESHHPKVIGLQCRITTRKLT